MALLRGTTDPLLIGGGDLGMALLRRQRDPLLTGGGDQVLALLRTENDPLLNGGGAAFLALLRSVLDPLLNSLLCLLAQSYKVFITAHFLKRGVIISERIGAELIEPFVKGGG